MGQNAISSCPCILPSSNHSKRPPVTKTAASLDFKTLPPFSPPKTWNPRQLYEFDISMLRRAFQQSSKKGLRKWSPRGPKWEPKSPKVSQMSTPGSTGGPPGGHRGATGVHRGPPGSTGGPPGCPRGNPGGHRGPPGATGFIKGYRSHRLNRAECDFELSLYSALYKIVNS